MIKQIFNNKVAIALATGALLSACDAGFDSPVNPDTAGLPPGTQASPGNLDLSRFVAVGDSLTAGYADGALYRSVLGDGKSGQESSYPAILAEQFAKVGGGTFSQPLMDDNLGGLLLGGAPLTGFDNRLVLDAASQAPEAISGNPSTELLPALNQNPLSGPFNNMGVPGAKSFHLAASGYGNLAGIFDVNTSQAVTPPVANPYFIRFASTADTSIIADATTVQTPTFFVLWIGNNDVLSYATSGGTGTDQTGNPNPATYGSTDITDPTAFAGIYTQLVGAFTAANPNAKGVLINIPDVATIPFFTTVPYNPIPLDSATAGALNAGFSTYNTAVQNAGLDATEVTKRTITFHAGEGNAPVILDTELTDLTAGGLPSLRQATAEDLIVLTASSKIGQPNTGPTDVWGLSNTSPLADADVLTPGEIDAINTARTAYNATIQAVADGNDNLIMFDAASRLAELASTGIDYGTGKITATYATGGGFSLDGVHPTARGYAVVANSIIDAMNSGFGSSIPKTDPGTFSTTFIK